MKDSVKVDVDTHSELLNMYLAWKEYVKESLDALPTQSTGMVPLEKCLACSRLILDITEMTKCVNYLGGEIDMTNVVYYFIQHDSDYKGLATYFE
tara:strand:+ start:284 stop:568 length:285 start_codon:yes stop_codon:yes gene_type:complete